MRIRDNGVSIHEDAVKNSSGNGLKNMSERASILNGEISVGESEGGGTEVYLKFPIN